MKSPVWRAMALLTLVVVVVGMASDANAARRSALAGNYFINDADDMFAFPQLYSQYQNMAIIDFAPSVYSAQMNGNATLTWGGEKNTLRFSTGRMDIAARTAAWTWGQFDRGSAMYSGSGFTGLGNTIITLPDDNSDVWAAGFFDLGWSTMLGETPFGIGFSWISGGNSFQYEGQDKNPDSSFNHFTVQVGATLGGAHQLAGEIGFGSGDNKAVAADGAKVSTFNAAVTARGDIDGAFGFDWRYLGGFAMGTASPKADGADSYNELAFRGSFGPVFGTPGEWEVAGYITLDYASYKDKNAEGNDTDDEEYTYFTLPGYNLAGEYYLNQWFVMRAGVSSIYAAYTEKNADDPADPATRWEYKQKEFYYMWTMGFGIDKQAWGLDFALEESAVHSGYFLNGSVGGDAFAYISGWFNW